jgi:hypothetical protein
MFQGYNGLPGGAFLQPTLSYIPTPGAWAMTMRFTLLF